jgi:hypothetical protein
MWFAHASPDPALRRLLWAVLVVGFSALLNPAHATVAEAQSADALRAARETRLNVLSHNQFQRPIHLESSDNGKRLRGDVYADINFPFAAVSKALDEPNDWCDIMLTHLNTKQCHVQQDKTGSVLVLSIVRKLDHPIEQAIELALRYRVTAATPEYLQVELESPQGPFGTSNYRILLQATALPDGRSFLHFSYAYDSTTLTRMVTQAYLATIGRGKVGFTIVGQRTDGTPDYLGGIRGLVERNAMRYFLAIEAYLGAVGVAPADQFEKRLDIWFSAIERYPRQLHDVERAHYLEVKRADRQRRLSPS